MKHKILNSVGVIGLAGATIANGTGTYVSAAPHRTETKTNTNDSKEITQQKEKDNTVNEKENNNIKKSKTTQIDKKVNESKSNQVNKDIVDIKENSTNLAVVASSILNEQKDLQVQVGNATTTQTGSNISSQGSNPSYYPGKIFNNGGKILLNGNVVHWQIPFSLTSLSGSSYKVKSVGLEFGTPYIAPINGSSDSKDITFDKKYFEANPNKNSNKLTTFYNFTNSPISDVTSSSTGMLNGSAKVWGTWKEGVLPKMNLVVTLENGEKIVKPVNLPVSYITNKSILVMGLKPMLQKDNSSYYLTFKPSDMFPLINVLANEKHVSASTYKSTTIKNDIDSVTVGVNLNTTASNSIINEASNFDIVSTNKDIVVEKTGGSPSVVSYKITLKGKALEDYKNGNIESIKKDLVIKTVGKIKVACNLTATTIWNASSVKLKNNDPLYSNTIEYNTNSESEFIPVQNGSLSIVQNTKAYGDLHPQSFSTSLKASGLNSTVTDKQFVMLGANGAGINGYLIFDKYLMNYLPNNAKYYYLNPSDILNAPKNVKNTLDLVEKGKGYTLSEIKAMIAKGEPVPNLNVIVSNNKPVDGKIDLSNRYITSIVCKNSSEYSKVYPAAMQILQYNKIISTDSNTVKELQKGDNKDHDISLNNGVILTDGGESADIVRYGNNSSGLSTGGNVRSMNSSLIFNDYPSGVLPYSAVGKVQPLSVLLGQGSTITGNKGMDQYIPKGSILTFKINGPFSIVGNITDSDNNTLKYEKEGNTLKVIFTKKQLINGGQYTYHLNIPIKILEYKNNYKVNYIFSDNGNLKLNYNNKIVDSLGYGDGTFNFNINKPSTSYTAMNSVSILKNKKATIYHTLSNTTDNNADIITMSSNLGNYNMAHKLKTDSGLNSSSIGTLPTDGVVYYITESKATQKDKEMLESPSANIINENYDYIKAHWTKYTGGTVPTNVIGFTREFELKANSSNSIKYTMNADINYKGNAYSQYKYFNKTVSLGSTSNIVKLTNNILVYGSAKITVVNKVTGKIIK
ncbi:hypothetical protein, partial [uncultured Clostridium sp.]|uniref:hypothetical protein n=1 Tax=uncultured Clostridium sp. TaxID=59620 RepID=UPI00262734CF